MSKAIDWDKRLDRVVEAKTDKIFLARLSKWLGQLSGNVNACQRLNILAIRIKKTYRIE